MPKAPRRVPAGASASALTLYELAHPHLPDEALTGCMVPFGLISTMEAMPWP
jgi:hypothetical protein